jgi:hypothetical protein
MKSNTVWQVFLFELLQKSSFAGDWWGKKAGNILKISQIGVSAKGKNRVTLSPRLFDVVSKCEPI